MSELHKFLFDGLPVRGMIVRLTDAWQEILQRRRADDAHTPWPWPVTQMLGEMDVALEFPQQVLAAAREAQDTPAPQRRLDLGRRERTCPARVEDLDVLDLAALDARRELAPDRLDLGKLRHPFSL